MSHQDALIGQRLANFRVERLLGRGGMASVYLGWDERLLRPVAVKVIDERYRDDPIFTARFLEEARAVAAWRHPNILQIFYAGEQEGLLYFVMEYLRGLDLEKILRQYAQQGELIPWEDVIAIGRAVASALDYAHNQGVIHRDVKPANVILEEEGRVVLADFGLARRLTQETMGQVFGSPHYISPEQARSSAEAGPRSDLYSFGVILYEALTGQVPFDDPSPATLALQHIVDEPPPPRAVNPELSPVVESVLLKALSKDPDDRFPSGEALMQALEAALADGPALELAQNNSSGPPTRVAKRASAIRAVELVARRLAEDPEANPPTLSFARPPQPAAGAPAPAAASPEAPEEPRLRATLAPGIAPGADSEMGSAGGIAEKSPVESRGRRGFPAGLAKPERSVLGCGTLLLLSVIAGILGLMLLLERLGAAAPLPLEPSRTAEPAAARQEESPITQAVQSAEAPPTSSGELPTPETPPAAETAETGEEPAEISPAEGQVRLELFYNDSSLYILNRSGRDLPITPLAFERLDPEGRTLTRLRGQYWAQIYPRFRDEYCIVTEIYDVEDYLRPAACQNRQVIVRTPTLDQDFLFWRSGEDSQEFRVLWNGEEIGRCQIDAGTCEAGF